MGDVVGQITDEIDVEDRAGREVGKIRDRFSMGQVLADQNGAGGVLTFSFSAVRSLIWVRADGGIARCDPFGGIPDATTGIRCDDGIPVPITFDTDTVKVYADVGVTVQVWGMSY
jgi:hypothetical protein